MLRHGLVLSRWHFEVNVFPIGYNTSANKLANFDQNFSKIPIHKFSIAEIAQKLQNSNK
jgi:hypothetical protein